MTTSRPTLKRRNRRKHTPTAGPQHVEEHKPFMQLVEKLRAYIDGLDKPLEEWTDEDHAGFVRLSGNDSLAIAVALSRPLSLGPSLRRCP